MNYKCIKVFLILLSSLMAQATFSNTVHSADTVSRLPTYREVAGTEANLVPRTPAACSLPGRTPLGIPRPRTCRITIPALPGRVVYYRLIYRDQAGNAIGNPVVGVSVVP